MKKEYENPLFRVVFVEKQDVLTSSLTTSDYQKLDKKSGQGNYSDGAYIGWGSALW